MFLEMFNFHQFRCCGVSEKNDWANVHGDNILPPSCCQKSIEDVNSCKMADGTDTGCYQILLDYMRNSFTVFTLVGIIVTLILVRSRILLYFNSSSFRKYLFIHSSLPLFLLAACTPMHKNFRLPKAKIFNRQDKTINLCRKLINNSN